MADVDISGMTEAEIEAWEEEHEQFATDERADAAAEAWEREHITPEVEALVGRRSTRRVMPSPIEAGELRRFTQAMMDPDPVFWDEAAARERG